MATAELAACLPVLALLVLIGLGAVSAANQQVRAQDAATEIARAQARGDVAGASRRFAEIAPAGATFTIETADGQVTATVRATVRPLGGRVPGFAITERSVAELEPP
jgi:hypothetical protein